jgi:thiamin-phosphate kinase
MLHVLTDREWSRGRDMLSVATAALDGGATIIQLRDKTASTRVLIEEGLALRALTRERGALLIVNDRVDVALAVEADGVHVGQDDMPAALARRLLGPHRILGVSAATMEEAEVAVAGGADYLGVGPIFPTHGKADAGPATGVQLLTELARRYATPLVAIGGITAENAPVVVRAGAAGVAVITAVVNAEDITAASRQLRMAVESVPRFARPSINRGSTLTKIAELGEFGLIARLTAGLPPSPDVIAGVGDDAAILDIGSNDVLVATCDVQVEDTHFRLRGITPHDIGRRALAVNLSDIAAMGARPRFALISLLVPPTLDVAVLDGIYAGLREEAAQFDVALVGGNIARNAERLIIDIMLLGTGTRNRLLRRNSAKPGDMVMVTGSLGSAAAGLLVLEDEQLAAKVAPENLVGVLAAQRTPTPRVAAGQWLAQHAVTTGIDVSDGLAADISHICEASGVGVQIEAESLPIQPETATVAALAGQNPQNLALFGGEDYELLFTVPTDRAHALARELFDATGVKATAIGTICMGSAITLFREGKPSPLPSTGWDHLRLSDP